MASEQFDDLEGELEITARPGTLCYGKPWEFVSILTNILRVKFPVRRGSRFLVYGPDTPSSDDRNTLWASFDRAGNPLGLFAFVKGAWRRFYTVAPGEIRWINGNSANPPPGWQPILQAAGGIPQAVFDKLIADYVDDGAGGYLYYAVKYVGY